MISISATEKKKQKNAYQVFFSNLMEKWGIKSPFKLDKETRSKFFEAVKEGWATEKAMKPVVASNDSDEIYDDEDDFRLYSSSTDNVKAVQAASKIINKVRSTATMEYSLELMEGPTWSRIVVVGKNKDGDTIDRSAWGFIDGDGKLWKSAGWKAPAKNKPRGILADLYSETKVQGWKYGIQ